MKKNIIHICIAIAVISSFVYQMVAGVDGFIIAQPEELGNPIFAAYGLFISSGIMKEKFKREPNASQHGESPPVS